MPNFSTTFFNSTIPELSNTCSELEISNDSENESTDNIGLPTYTSSPIQIMICVDVSWFEIASNTPP
jgi:hypothetical protein